ncbi:MAG TPA: peptide chain release factor N(5)-glutamine methyltransferase [Bacteroidota bacterium]|nr:peptide chain release factor N(5)-glutamine methyltransferase [Bacteroidota bacterium]
MTVGETLRGEPARKWTILPLLAWAEQYLRERSFDEARLNAELLLARALGLKRLDLYLQFDRPLTPAELGAFRGLFLRRLAHEPVQYVLGETEFMGFALEVNRSVLIPRPETEELVEDALAWLRAGGNDEARILEMGTGSGNVAVALGSFLPRARITTVDVSPEATTLARRNCGRHGVSNVEFLTADFAGAELPPGAFALLIANPPYISAAGTAELAPEVKEFEPLAALTDGGDGLSFIRMIASRARSLLAPGGGMFLEIGAGQEDEALHIAREAGLSRCSVKKDFAGIGRILRAFAGEGPGP